MSNNTVFGDMDVAQLNDAIKAEINSVKDGGICKLAAESGNSYIRMQLFEEGFTRRILPAQPVDYSELNQFYDETLGMIIEVEPTQAVSAQFLLMLLSLHSAIWLPRQVSSSMTLRLLSSKRT